MTDAEIIEFVEKQLRIAEKHSVLPERRPWALPKHRVEMHKSSYGEREGKEVRVSFPDIPYFGSTWMPRNVENWDDKRIEFQGLAEALVNQLANIGPCKQTWGGPCWGHCSEHYWCGAKHGEEPVVCAAHWDMKTKVYKPKPSA